MKGGWELLCLNASFLPCALCCWKKPKYQGQPLLYTGYKNKQVKRMLLNMIYNMLPTFKPDDASTPLC